MSNQSDPLQSRAKETIKDLTIAAGSALGAVVGYNLTKSPIGMGVGAGFAGGMIKGNYNITNSSGTVSEDWSLMEHIKDIPFMCAARIGGLTYLVFNWYRPGNTELTNVGLSGFVGGLSEFFVPADTTDII